jgi:hypothetical protein
MLPRICQLLNSLSPRFQSNNEIRIVPRDGYGRRVVESKLDLSASASTAVETACMRSQSINLISHCELPQLTHRDMNENTDIARCHSRDSFRAILKHPIGMQCPALELAGSIQSAAARTG